jgi:hypothetical protein
MMGVSGQSLQINTVTAMNRNALFFSQGRQFCNPVVCTAGLHKKFKGLTTTAQGLPDWIYPIQDIVFH